MPIERCAVGVMARAPSLAGKTRLLPHLSLPRLAALRAALLADTLDRVGKAADDGTIDGVIFFTPAGAASEIAAASAGRFVCVCQSEGDLGQRMRSALEELLGPRGYGAAMLVGVDIPFLGVQHLLQARDVLRAHGGVVLGPSDDGGYYLIGMTKVYDGLFEQIEWGTGSVLSDTLRAAERLSIDARLTGSTYDVDTVDDLHRLERDLASAPSIVAPHVRRWFEKAAGE
jgi:rSAM/selenodomain-associated transferase 1